MKTILIVEDDADVLECLKMAIECPEFNIITAIDGDDAWDKLNSTHVDVLVTDYLMPNMDGATLSRLVNLNFPEMPILMISTFNPRDFGIHNIINGFLPKPFDLDFLKEKIDSMLSEGVR